MSDLFGLWPHQDKGVCEIQEAWRLGIKSVCFQLSTGGGKSRIIRTIVDMHAISGKVIYVIAHRERLVKQLSDELTDAGIKHGIIQSGRPYLKYRVQVCSIQTLANRIDKLSYPELIIIDEAHHVKANNYVKVIDAWPDALILGVTATPQRLDGKPLNDIFDKLIIGPPMRDLIDKNYLSDYDYFAPDTVDLSGVHHQAGEYKSSEILERVDKRSIIGSAVEHYKLHADHEPAIACCVSIAHAEHVAEQFREAGYKALAVHSKMSGVDEAINGLKDGSLEILCQCELLGEGVDIKGAVCLIGLRPTESLVIFLQQTGRVLRYVKGKRAIILDHVGNWERHGLPDDERKWSLSGAIKKDMGISKLKRCPDCLHPVPTVTRVCEYCGHQWTETANIINRIPEEKSGVLINVKDRAQKNNLVIEIARSAKTLKEAIEIAKSHGVVHTQAYNIWTGILKNKC